MALYGTLETQDGRHFSGYICWDVDEVLGKDVLDGTDEDGRKRKHERNELVAWGEFYLQTVGLIPFDPAELQS